MLAFSSKHRCASVQPQRGFVRYKWSFFSCNSVFLCVANFRMLRPRWKKLALNLLQYVVSFVILINKLSTKASPPQSKFNWLFSLPVGIIPHHGDVVCYIFTASNSFASYRQPSWNESQTYSLNDRFALTSREQVTGCVGVPWIFRN